MTPKTDSERIAELEAEVADLRSQLGTLLGMLYLKEMKVTPTSGTPQRVMRKVTSHPEDIRLVVEKTDDGFRIKTTLEAREEPEPVRRDAWSRIAED